MAEEVLGLPSGAPPVAGGVCSLRGLSYILPTFFVNSVSFALELNPSYDFGFRRRFRATCMQTLSLQYFVVKREPLVRFLHTIATR
jgi:hypothetical protein